MVATVAVVGAVAWVVFRPVPEPRVATPARVASGLCEAFPSAVPVRPTAENTGVPAGTVLTPRANLVIDVPGVVIDGRDMTGGIEVKADNVTIKNSRLRVTGWYGITVANGVTGTKIVNNDIFTSDGGYIGIDTSESIVCGNHIRGFENGITMGGNTIVQGNLIGDFQGRPGSDPHYDGIEMYSGSNSRIWNNDIRLVDRAGVWRRSTGAINVTASKGDILDVDIRGNWIGGGSYTLYLDADEGHLYRDVTVVDNRWYGTGPTGKAAWGPLAIDHSAGVKEFSGNRWDDGTPLEGP